MPFCVVDSSAIPEGGDRGSGPPGNHKLYEFQQGISNWTTSPPLEKVGPPLGKCWTPPPPLSWNTHINNVTSTANKTLGFVKRNVVTKNKDIKTMAYNSLVRPQVEYASAIWSPYTKGNIFAFKKIHERFLHPENLHAHR